MLCLSAQNDIVMLNAVLSVNSWCDEDLPLVNKIVLEYGKQVCADKPVSIFEALYSLCETSSEEEFKKYVIGQIMAHEDRYKVTNLYI